MRSTALAPLRDTLLVALGLGSCTPRPAETPPITDGRPPVAPTQPRPTPAVAHGYVAEEDGTVHRASAPRCAADNPRPACVDPGQHSSCTADSECPSSYCVDGVCCESACTVQCRACNLPGKVGQCAQFPSGTEDPGVCDGTKACSGNAGTCRLKNGQPCTYDLECSSTLCSNGICEDP